VGLLVLLGMWVIMLCSYWIGTTAEGFFELLWKSMVAGLILSAVGCFCFDLISLLEAQDDERE
jgi:tetrahydromethanopterin S-methyltransferase subunit D